MKYHVRGDLKYFSWISQYPNKSEEAQMLLSFYGQSTSSINGIDLYFMYKLVMLAATRSLWMHVSSINSIN